MSDDRIRDLQTAEGYFRERLAEARADLAASQSREAGLIEEGQRKDAKITSLRDQRNYLVAHRDPPDDARLRETISRLRERLRNTREMFDRQVAVTRCQRAKTGRVGNAAWTARQESVTFEYQTVDQAATILVLEQQIRAANARADGLRAALETHGAHFTTPFCLAGSMAGPCTCGLAAILATEPEARAGEASCPLD